MDPGNLRHQITLQQRSNTQDALGQPMLTWVDYLKCSASVKPLSGRELFAAQAVQSEVTHHITIRWREALSDPRVLAAMRVAFKGRYFNIHSAICPLEDQVAIVMEAGEGLSPG